MANYDDVELDDFVLSYRDAERISKALRAYKEDINTRRERILVKTGGRTNHEIAGLNRTTAHIVELLQDLQAVMFETRRKIALKSSESQEPTKESVG